MGIFRRIGDWLTEKSERFIRGESDGTGGYYATREAEQAYGGMGMDQEPVQDGMEGEEAPAGSRWTPLAMARENMAVACPIAQP